MALGILLALVSCVLYGTATLLQAVGSRKAEGLRAFLQPLVIIGLVVDGTAFLISLVAYDHAPLFVVQTIIAAAVVVAVLGAPRFLPVHLRRTDLVGVGVVLVGLIVVAASAGAEHAVRPGGHFVWRLVVLTVVLVVLAAVSYPKAPAWFMASLSGLGYSLVAIGARAAEADGSLIEAIFHPVVIVVLGGGLVGVVGNIRALERGSVAVAASIVAVIEVVVPSAIGVTLLGDEVRAG